ncbi:aminotransferase class-III family protein, partial [Vibrio parahaemolyticus V-223/04]|jgi:glycerol-3-phosphate dehydrogenase
LQR